MTVRIAEQDADLVRIAPVMLQLRPAYTLESLVAQIREQRARGFQVLYHRRRTRQRARAM